MVWYAGMRMPNKCRHKCRPSIHPRLVLLIHLSGVEWSVWEIATQPIWSGSNQWSHVFNTYYSTHNTESLIIMRDVMPGKSCHRPTSQLVRWFRTWLSVGSGIECSLLFTVQSKQQNEIQLWQIEVSGSTWHLKKRKVHSIWDISVVGNGELSPYDSVEVDGKYGVTRTKIPFRFCHMRHDRPCQCLQLLTQFYCWWLCVCPARASTEYHSSQPMVIYSFWILEREIIELEAMTDSASRQVRGLDLTLKMWLDKSDEETKVFIRFIFSLATGHHRYNNADIEAVRAVETRKEK